MTKYKKYRTAELLIMIVGSPYHHDVELETELCCRAAGLSKEFKPYEGESFKGFLDRAVEFLLSKTIQTKELNLRRIKWQN